MKTTDPDLNKQSVNIVYTNHRGETKTRCIIPKKIWYGRADWHPNEQWILEAYDLEKEADRSFAMKDIRAWYQEDS